MKTETFQWMNSVLHFYYENLKFKHLIFFLKRLSIIHKLFPRYPIKKKKKAASVYIWYILAFFFLPQLYKHRFIILHHSLLERFPITQLFLIKMQCLIKLQNNILPEKTLSRIHIMKIVKMTYIDGLGWTARQTKNWLWDRTQRVVVNGSSSRLEISGEWCQYWN